MSRKKKTVTEIKSRGPEEWRFHDIYVSGFMRGDKLACGAGYMITDIHGNLEKADNVIFKASGKYKMYMKNVRCIYAISAILKSAISTIGKFSESISDVSYVTIYTSEPFMYAMLVEKWGDQILKSRIVKEEGIYVRSFIEWRKQYYGNSSKLCITPKLVPENFSTMRELRFAVKREVNSPRIVSRVIKPGDDIVVSSITLEQILN